MQKVKTIEKTAQAEVQDMSQEVKKMTVKVFTFNGKRLLVKMTEGSSLRKILDVLVQKGFEYDPNTMKIKIDGKDVKVEDMSLTGDVVKVQIVPKMKIASGASTPDAMSFKTMEASFKKAMDNSVKSFHVHTTLSTRYVKIRKITESSEKQILATEELLRNVQYLLDTTAAAVGFLTKLGEQLSVAKAQLEQHKKALEQHVRQTKDYIEQDEEFYRKSLVLDKLVDKVKQMLEAEQFTDEDEEEFQKLLNEVQNA